MKRLRRLLRTIFPPPRRPVTLRQVLLLVVFLVAYFGICAALVVSHQVLFVRPSMFALMAVCVWIWWMYVAGYSGLPGRRAGMAFLVRALVVGVFCVALAEPRAVRTSDLLSVVYAIDLSDSIGEGSTQSALDFMSNTVSNKPERDQAGLVVFGRNAAAELPPRQAFPFDSGSVSINSHVDRGATNIEQALSLSAAMLPEENAGRIVLISDGAATEGSLTRILDDLKSRDIAVDVLPVQYDYSHEVWLERLDLPRFVKIGDNYEGVIVLSSLQNGSGRLVVREQGRVISEQPVDFRAGKNRYVVPIKLREPGYYEYSATIETPTGADQLKQNNTVLNYLYVKGEGRVMVVRDSAGKAQDWQSLVAALKAEQRLVDVFTAEQFPRDALSLMPYDAVIFVNVAADAFDPVQFKAVHDAVRDLGVGFLMVGGRNSFGPGGYNKTPIEDVLPVTMDITKKKILPKGALVIVLHTCEFPEGNTYAKRVTKEAIRVLGSQDEAGVLAFMGGDSSWVFELTPVSQYDAMVRKINAATPGDMPSFQPIMEAGYTALAKSDAAAKHMIVISDGDPQPPNPKLLQDCKAKEITISTVSIYPHGGIEVGTLQAMANLTGGRYYTTNDPDQLPSIFIKEAKSLKRAMVLNKTFTPEIGFPSPVLKGLGSLPPLHGYVLTTPKERLTEEILQAHLPEEESARPRVDSLEIRIGHNGRLYLRPVDKLGCRVGGLGGLSPVRQATHDRHRSRPGGRASADVGLLLRHARRDRGRGLSSAEHVPRDAGAGLRPAGQIRIGHATSDRPAPLPGNLPPVGTGALPGHGHRQVGRPHGSHARRFHRLVFARISAVPLESHGARRNRRKDGRKGPQEGHDRRRDLSIAATPETQLAADL